MTDLAKIPCTIVTGFLGAGKTTLVRNLLQNAGGRRLAVLVNEFGDIGFDGSFIEGCGISGCTEDDIVELPNGCICCTVADDFVPALTKLLDRPNPPEHILIETSGLALPKPLVTAFNWPAIRSRVTVDGVIAVVDGPAVAAGFFADDPEALAAQRAADQSVEHDNPLEEVFEDQLLCADMILLNKTDLMSDDDKARVKAEINEHLPRSVKIVETDHSGIETALILGLKAAAGERPCGAALASRRGRARSRRFRQHRVPGRHRRVRRSAGRPASARRRKPTACCASRVSCPSKARPMRLVVQGVGRRIAHHYDRPWTTGEDRQGRLVVIGLKGFDRASVEAALAG